MQRLTFLVNLQLRKVQSWLSFPCFLCLEQQVCGKKTFLESAQKLSRQSLFCISSHFASYLVGPNSHSFSIKARLSDDGSVSSSSDLGD